MPYLLETLDALRKSLVIVHVYLTEAHADDVWPLGYGILQPNNIEERWANADRLFEKHDGLKERIDTIFCDNMNNDFNSTTGSWPESYMFADKDGKCSWKSMLDDKSRGPRGEFEDVERVARENGWWTEKE